MPFLAAENILIDPAHGKVILPTNEDKRRETHGSEDNDDDNDDEVEANTDTATAGAKLLIQMIHYLNFSKTRIKLA